MEKNLKNFNKIGNFLISRSIMINECWSQIFMHLQARSISQLNEYIKHQGEVRGGGDLLYC